MAVPAGIYEGAIRGAQTHPRTPYEVMVALGALRDAAIDGGLTSKFVEEITARVDAGC